MNEEQPTFKVTDRRLFNADGSPREVAPEEVPPAAAATESQVTDSPASSGASAAAQPAATPSSPAPEAAEREPIDEKEIPDVDDPAGFLNFTMSLASNAAASLGLMEHPASHKREVDLELAKHWIDVLGMLQHKTRGNLTPQESQILEGWLSDLRMQYVSLSHSSSGRVSQPFTGQDILGGK